MDKNTAFWIPIGISIGTAVGVATDNLVLWLPIGVSLGAVMSAMSSRGMSGSGSSTPPPSGE